MTANAQRLEAQPMLMGHPTGLFTLFFAEMWERFSYYGMRALLVYYLVKGFMGLGDGDAYALYGAYTALVYATPFIGGLIADRLLGQRRAVVLGGLLMAAGHGVMAIESETALYTALALLILGNGFFKPNISTIVGSLYPEGSGRKDAGFTIFYMGINLGAAIAPLLCGYVGETYGWHLGFGLATIGMLTGVAIFVLPQKLNQLIIPLGAIATAVAMMVFVEDNLVAQLVNGFTALILVLAGIIAFVALGKGGLPDWAGRAADEGALKETFMGIPKGIAVYLGTLLMVPVIVLILMRDGVAGVVLMVIGAAALGYLFKEMFTTCTKIQRDRLLVVIILCFFNMLFWAFFEQAGSSVNLFTDRNVDRVFETEVVTDAQVGDTLKVTLTQEQLGYSNGDTLYTMDVLDKAREEGAIEVDWVVDEADVGMGLATPDQELKASKFQAANPIYIIIFALFFSWLWVWLDRRKMNPSTPIKFALGIAQLGLGFGALWYGAQTADASGMVGVSWLLLGYLLITTGELCLSPVGLAAVTNLAPVKLVSTVMGFWFLSTAFSNYLAAFIATFTGVSHGGGGAEVTVPPPTETLNVYGDVFGTIGLWAIGAAVLLVLISPLLKRMMHLDAIDATSATGAGH